MIKKFPTKFKQKLIEILDAHQQYIEKNFEPDINDREACKAHITGNTKTFFNIYHTDDDRSSNYRLERSDLLVLEFNEKGVFEQLDVWTTSIPKTKDETEMQSVKFPEKVKIELNLFIAKYNEYIIDTWSDVQHGNNRCALTLIKNPKIYFAVLAVDPSSDTYGIDWTDVNGKSNEFSPTKIKLNKLFKKLQRWMDLIVAEQKDLTVADQKTQHTIDDKIKSPKKPIKPTILAIEFNQELVMKTTAYLLKVDNRPTNIREIWGEIDSEECLKYLSYLFDDGILHHETNSTLEVMLTTKGLSLKREQLDENGRFLLKSQDNSPEEKTLFPAAFQKAILSFQNENDELLGHDDKPGNYKFHYRNEPELFFIIAMNGPNNFIITKVDRDKTGYITEPISKLISREKVVFACLKEWRDNVIGKLNLFEQLKIIMKTYWKRFAGLATVIAVIAGLITNSKTIFDSIDYLFEPAPDSTTVVQEPITVVEETITVVEETITVVTVDGASDHNLYYSKLAENNETNAHFINRLITKDPELSSIGKSWPVNIVIKPYPAFDLVSPYNPALVIIHYSTFEKDSLDTTGPVKLNNFLSGFANMQTVFLIYSRGSINEQRISQATTINVERIKTYHFDEWQPFDPGSAEVLIFKNYLKDLLSTMSKKK